jgi:hypothetical protein
MRMREQDIQREILRYLHARGIFAWKSGVGAFRATYKEKDRLVRFGLRGQSDIVGLIPPSGRMLALEVKSGKAPTTPHQDLFLKLVTRSGGVAAVVHSVKETHELLHPLLSEASRGAG